MADVRSERVSVEVCRFCAGAGKFSDVVLDLGPQPVDGGWPHPTEHSEQVAWLTMWMCEACGLSQLGTSGAPVPQLIDVDRTAAEDEITRLVSDLLRSTHAEVGALVNEFGDVGTPWSAQFADRGLLPTSGPADLVIDSLAMAHEEDQAAAITSRADATAEGGVLGIFFNSLAAMITGREWNQVQHGRYAYYSLTALVQMFDRVGMAAVDVMTSDLHSRSLLLLLRRRSDPLATDRSPPLEALLSAERQLGVTDAATVRRELGLGVSTATVALREYLSEAKRAGVTVYGYGAPTRILSVLSMAHVGPDLLPAIVDDSPQTDGRVTPVTRIPIVSEAQMLRDQPHEVLVFSPHQLDDIKQALPQLGGRLIPHRLEAKYILGPNRRATETERSVRSGQRLREVTPPTSARLLAETAAGGSNTMMVRGRGALAWDLDNNCYVEYGIGSGAATLGHADPRVANAITKALADGESVGGASWHELRVAEKFVDLVADAEWVSFVPSVAEATAIALTVAKAATGRPMVAVVRPKVGNVGISADEVGFGESAEVVELRFNDLFALESAFIAHHERLAAVVVPPVTPTQTPVTRYLDEIRGLCDRHGVMMIFDQTMAGFRWPVRGVHRPTRVVPDLAIWGRSIGNGHAVAGLSGLDQVRALTTADAFTTVCSRPVANAGQTALAAVEAVIEAHQTDEPVRHIYDAGVALRERIEEVIAREGLTDVIGVEGSPRSLQWWTHDLMGESSPVLAEVLRHELMMRGVLSRSLATSAPHDSARLLDHTVFAVAGALPAYRRALDSLGTQTMAQGRPAS